MTRPSAHAAQQGEGLAGSSKAPKLLDSREPSAVWAAGLPLEDWEMVALGKSLSVAQTDWLFVE